MSLTRVRTTLPVINNIRHISRQLTTKTFDSNQQDKRREAEIKQYLRKEESKQTHSHHDSSTSENVSDKHSLHINSVYYPNKKDMKRELSNNEMKGNMPKSDGNCIIL